MHRVRNAVIIIVLCIVGAMTFKKKQLMLSMPTTADLKDAVAANNSAPKLTLAGGNLDDLRDSVAGHAVGTPGSNNGNTVDDVPPPPRGSGNGGFGPSANNPTGNFTPPGTPETLSPSQPEQPSEENFQQER